MISQLSEMGKKKNPTSYHQGRRSEEEGELYFPTSFSSSRVFGGPIKNVFLLRNCHLHGFEISIRFLERTRGSNFFFPNLRNQSK